MVSSLQPLVAVTYVLGSTLQSSSQLEIRKQQTNTTHNQVIHGDVEIVLFE